MERSRLYKNKNKDTEELRRRRNDQSIELRKVKKDEQLQKRRNINLSDVEEFTPLKEKQVDAAERVDYDEIISNMSNGDINNKYDAVQLCRKTLSRAKNPPIDEFFMRGAVKILVDALSSDNQNLVFESAWALTNIASGESKHTKGVVEAGAVPKLIALLDLENVSIAEQSVWALGNIAGDGATYRDFLIKNGVVAPVIKLLERTWNSSPVVSNIAWMLSNICRNRDPPPPHATVKTILPVLTKLLNYEGNEAVVADTAWAISYASDAVNDFINYILESGCVQPLLKLLGSKSPTLIAPALRAIGNLVIGNDDQTQKVLDAGLLDYVPVLLNNAKATILKESCWMVSNVAAGSVSQIQALIDHNLVPIILEILNKSEFRVQKEACWVISNMINGGNPEQCAYLLNQGVLNSLSHLLSASDTRVVTMVLDALKKIFQVAEVYNQLEPCCLALETCGGLDTLELLQDHTNEEIYRCAFEFIEKYFNDANESEEAQGTDAATVETCDTSATQEFNFRDPSDAPADNASSFNF